MPASIVFFVEINNEANYIFISHNGTQFIPSKKDYLTGFGLTNIDKNSKLINAKVTYQNDNPKIEIKLPPTSKEWGFKN